MYGYDYISVANCLIKSTTYYIYEATKISNSISDISHCMYIYSLYNNTTFQQRDLVGRSVISSRQLQRLAKRNLLIKLETAGYIINPLILPFLDKLNQDYKKILTRKKII